MVQMFLLIFVENFYLKYTAILSSIIFVLSSFFAIHLKHVQSNRPNYYLNWEKCIFNQVFYGMCLVYSLFKLLILHMRYPKICWSPVSSKMLTNKQLISLALFVLSHVSTHHFNSEIIRLNILYLNWSAINPALNWIVALCVYHENFSLDCCLVIACLLSNWETLKFYSFFFSEKKCQTW